MARSKTPFRDAAFLLVVRNRLGDRLVKEEGYSRSEAREAARELADATIEEAATRVAPKAKVGAGGLLSFLLEFLASDQFRQLLDILLSLFTASGMGAARSAVAPEAGGTAPEEPAGDATGE